MIPMPVTNSLRNQQTFQLPNLPQIQLLTEQYLQTIELKSASANPPSTKISSTLFATLISASAITSTSFGGRTLQFVRAPQSKRIFCFVRLCLMRKQKVGRRSFAWPAMGGWMKPEESIDMFVVVLMSWTSTTDWEDGGRSMVGTSMEIA